MSIRIGVKINAAPENWIKILLNKTAKYQIIKLAVITSLFLTGHAIAAAAGQQLFEAYKPVIVIDPGHGGSDFGARGPDGGIEKAVALRMARILAAELQREYRVVMTRTDDYQVDLDKRTATANHHNADIFISIHTAGSFVHGSSGIFIFHYHDFNEKPQLQGGSTSFRQQDNKSTILWDQVQNRYLEKSRTLARILNDRLNALSVVEDIRIQGAPLAVLKGADMPAILIEFGYLTNPAEGKKIQDQRFLTDIATAISRGIDEYFSQIK